MNRNAYQSSGNLAGSFSGMVQQGSLLSNFTYYVDATNGLDTNDGLTPDTALQTLTAVNSLTMNPGESVGFKKGETFTGQLNIKSGAVDNRVVYGAYGHGAKPIITRSDASSTLSINGGDNWTIKSLSIINTNGASATAITAINDIVNASIIDCDCSSLGYGIKFAGSIDNIELWGFNLTSAGNVGIYSYGATANNVTISSSIINEKVWFIGAATSGISVISSTITDELDIRNGDNVTVTSCDLANIDISSCTGYLRIESNNIHDKNASGVLLNNCAYSDAVVSQNISKDNQYGYRLLSTTGVDLNNNVAYSASTTGFHIGTCSNVNVTGCFAKDNFGDGFATNDNCNDVIFKYCRSTGNGDKTSTTAGDGYTSHLNDYNIKYLYCIADNNTCSGFAHIQNSSGLIYGCTSYNNAGDWSGEGGVDQVRANVYLPVDGVNPTTLDNWTVRNCIVANGYPRELYIYGANDLDYNCYYALDSDKFKTNGTTEISWTAYSSNEPNSIYQNPNLTNLIPDTEIESAADLGASYNDGLDVLTVWGNGTTIPVIVTKQQPSTWQNGAYVQ